jgi:hypothetical protein
VDDSERWALEQELRDERARRREAERRLDDLTEKADIWRDRAEERTERINRLLEAQQRKGASLRRWVKTITGGSNVAPARGVAEEPDDGRFPPSGHPWPGQKSVFVVTAVEDPGKCRALDSFDRRALEVADAEDLDRADLVVVDPAALSGLDDRARALLREWGESAARQPLVVWGDGEDEEVSELSPTPAIMITSDARTAQRLDRTLLVGCFDPGRHSPLEAEEAVHSLDLSSLPNVDLEVIEKSAMGIGTPSAPGSGTAARRWAYRNHAPWIRSQQLLDVAGVSAPSPIPSIAAVLVSKRPEVIPAMIKTMSGQTQRPSEMVVAIHGGGLTAEVESAAAGTEMRVTLLPLDAELTFGECLNIAARHTTASLLAKIDDDDHYGPAHLEDSFHALCYSGADIVGKGAHYTYVAAEDITVLRRPGLEERFVDGSPNGATLVFRRQVWDAVGFPHRPRHVDTGFLRAARSIGASVYVGSRWEFCYVRGVTGHTWDAEEAVFLAGSEPAWEGFEPGRVEVPDVESR